MLLGFSSKDFKSIKGEASCSFYASKEKRYKEHLMEVKGTGDKALPVALIYGENATGKSHFYESFLFLKNLILNFAEDENFSLEAFLEKEGISPLEFNSEFNFEFSKKSQVYSYSLSFKEGKVEKEEFLRQTGLCITVFFRREAQDFTSYALNDDDLSDSLIGLSPDVRETEPFLSKLIREEVPDFEFFTSFLKEHLIFVPKVQTDTFFSISEGEKRKQLLENHMPYLVDDFKAFAFKPAYKKDSSFFDEKLYQKGKELFKDKPFILKTKEGNILRFSPHDEAKFEVLYSVYKRGLKGERSYPFGEESSGIKRLYDILPVFSSEGKKKDTIFIVDDLDAFLGTLSLRELFLDFLFLGETHKKRHQILGTIRNVSLMDEDLFRNDELWFIEKTMKQTALYSLTDFKDNEKRDVQKDLCDGRIVYVPPFFLR